MFGEIKLLHHTDSSDETIPTWLITIEVGTY